MSLMLGNGHFLVPDRPGPHVIGGANAWDGAQCPNCSKSLMLHVTLDTGDPAFAGMKWTTKKIPLLYCCRCILYQFPFAYQIESDSRVEVMQVSKLPSETNLQEWKETGIGDEFPRRSAALIPMSARLQELIGEINKDYDGKRVYTNEFWKLTQGYREEGPYPVIEPLNQVMGMGIAWAPIRQLTKCDACKDGSGGSSALFLASLYNDRTHNLKFTFDCQELLFFLCTKCSSINVTHLL